MKTTFTQEVLLQGLPTLAPAIYTTLTLGVERGGVSFLSQQMECQIMACLLHGCVGPLLLHLLHAAIEVRLQFGEHAYSKDGQGLRLFMVMELLKCLLLAQPGMPALQGTPPATLDILQASLLWWAIGHEDARAAADKLTLAVSGCPLVYNLYI